FANVAVAARAEYHNKFAACIRSQAFERLLESVRLVGIVVENGRTIVRTGEFQPAFGSGQLFQCCERARRLGPGCYRKARGKTGILHLERANKRQPDRVCSSGMSNCDDLRKAIDG